MALKKTRLEVSKERKCQFDRRASTALSLLFGSRALARLLVDNSRGGDRVETESSSCFR